MDLKRCIPPAQRWDRHPWDVAVNRSAHPSMTVIAIGLFYVKECILVHLSQRNIGNFLASSVPLLQEGQHPLTGQCAANFRLLANQWTERKLLTQWHHGCHAMGWSVRNASASNGGRSLCVQISREPSYPLPIYWYHSKGNWLCYSCATDSFYIMKLCSRLFVLYCRNCPKNDKFR